MPILGRFYKRFDVIFEVVAGTAIGMLAYAEMLSWWGILILIAVRQIAAVRGMNVAQKDKCDGD